MQPSHTSSQREGRAKGSNGAPRDRANTPILQVEGMRKLFGGFAAVEGVTFAVRPRELRVIIGPNGAGKTTLFHLISGYERPTAGRVLLRGEDITHLRPQ